MPIWCAWSLAWDIASASCCSWARERSWSWSIACIPASWARALLLLDELLDKRQPLAHVLGLGLEFRYRELRLDIYLLEPQGILVVIGAEGLGVLNPPDSNTALLVVAPRCRRQRRDSHGRLNRSATAILRDLYSWRLGVNACLCGNGSM